MTKISVKTKKNAHLWVRDPDDWYVEEESCSRRLFEMETFEGFDSDGRALHRSAIVILDPSCGIGHIVESAYAAGYDAYGADLHDRTDALIQWPFTQADFLANPTATDKTPHWIVSNPPFKHCGMRYPNDPPPPYIALALDVATVGCAFLLPLCWIAGAVRSQWLQHAGLAKVLVLTPRPSMPPGAVIMAGEKPGGGEEDFAWFIFRKGHTGPWTGGWCDHRPLRETLIKAA